MKQQLIGNKGTISLYEDYGVALIKEGNEVKTVKFPLDQLPYFIHEVQIHSTANGGIQFN